MDTSGQALAKDLIELLRKFNLRKKIIAYVKDEGSNLNTSMTATLQSIVNYNILGLQESFQGSCFGHAFSKAFQYATTDEKVCKGLKYVSIKTIQFDLQKYITWPKKSRKVKQEWNKACVISNLPKRNLNTSMKTR
jgi:hypothetical protein